MPDGWKGMFGAAKNMVDSEGYPTKAVGWESWKLLTIPDAHDISEGLLV